MVTLLDDLRAVIARLDPCLKAKGDILIWRGPPGIFGALDRELLAGEPREIILAALKGSEVSADSPCAPVTRIESGPYAGFREGQPGRKPDPLRRAVVMLEALAWRLDSVRRIQCNARVTKSTVTENHPPRAGAGAPARGGQEPGASGEDYMRTSQYFSGSYLKSSDLPRPATVTIDHVREEEVGDEGKKETKVVLYFQNKTKGLVLNRTNNDILIALFGDDETDHWIGHPVQLWVDPSVTFGNTRGGIRIRPVPQPAAAHAPAPRSRPAPPPPQAVEQPAAAYGDGEFPPADSEIPF